MKYFLEKAQVCGVAPSKNVFLTAVVGLPLFTYVTQWYLIPYQYGLRDGDTKRNTWLSAGEPINFVDHNIHAFSSVKN